VIDGMSLNLRSWTGSSHNRAAAGLSAAGPFGSFRKTDKTPISAAGRLYMDWGEVAELVRAGMEIGGHSVSHRSLWALSEAETLREIRDSGDCLRQRLGTEITSYSYPFGHVLPQHPGMLAPAGYANAVTVRRSRNDPQTDRFELGRYGVNSTVSWYEIGCLCLDRSSDPIERLKRRLGRSCRYSLANPETGLVTITDSGTRYDTTAASIAYDGAG
jgi:peptidoglycan/xylan/chitin deacetylase (PgdA/CDA1 family)